MIIVKAIFSDGHIEKFEIYDKTLQNDRDGALKYTIFKRAKLNRPQRLEWIVNPITNDTVMGIVDLENDEYVIFEIA